MKYRVVWEPVQFKPEFLAALARKQVELQVRLLDLDDQTRSDYKANPLIYMLPVFGALLGALIGALLS